MGEEPTPLQAAFVAAGYDGEVPHPDNLTSDELVAVYIELAKCRDAARAHEKRISAAFNALEEAVVDHFQEEGKQRDTRLGRTVSLVEETWPKVVKEDLLKELPEDASKEALKAVDERARQRLVEALANDPTTEHLAKMTYNATTLRSFIIHDLEEDPETLEKVIPEHLVEVLSTATKFRARVTKAT